MNNEIKEILEELENMYEISELEEQVNNINKIRDYITNLQQIEQEHKKINGELREKNSKLEIALQNIQEDYDRRTKENERLKEQANENKVIVEYAIKPSFTTRKLNDYKSRCEKAIEYIKHHTDKLTKIRVPKLDFNYENLLEILQGENNE